MKKRFPFWTLGLLGIAIVGLAPALYFLPDAIKPSPNPADYLPEKLVHVDHADIVQGEFITGQDVTRARLECHADAATDLMKTTHWTWRRLDWEALGYSGDPLEWSGRDQ